MKLPGLDSVKGFLWRGALAGLAGGVAAALFLWLVTERQIRRALALEEGDHADEIFHRSTQVLGGMLGAVVYGLVIGVVISIVGAVLWRELPGRSPFGRLIRLAAVGFVAWVLVPALKYPPNPPGVGDPDTVSQRTLWYVVLLGLSVGLALLTWRVWQQLTAQGWTDAGRFAAVGGLYCGVLAVVYVALPASPDAVDLPASIVWYFRLDSIAGNALLWITAGAVLGWLADRAGGRARAGDRPELTEADGRSS